MRGRSKQRLRNSEVSEFTRINAAPARRGSRRRRHGIAVQSPRKEKEPDKIGFIFFSCGGDEGVRSKQRLRNSEVSEFTRINAAPARRGSRRRRHGIAVQSPRKEKEPDKIRFVFFICGGDEGGRTPYLLNAIQALYQLSYTPKADNKRKYTIFTSFCQLHLNKWVKCFGTNFFVYLIHSRFARARVART